MRIAICDDDKTRVATLSQALQAAANLWEVPITLDCYNSGRAMLFQIEDEARRPDVIYLDISMPGENGVDVAKSIRSMNYDIEIIFQTVSEDHMLDGFDVNAFHYIVKGKTQPEKFNDIFRRVTQRISDKKEEYITFSCAGESVTVPVRSILWFSVDKQIVTVHYKENGDTKAFEFYTTLKKVENILCGKGFLRIHNSCIVARNRVERVRKNEVMLLDGTRLPVGRAYAANLQELK